MYATTSGSQILTYGITWLTSSGEKAQEAEGRFVADSALVGKPIACRRPLAVEVKQSRVRPGTYGRLLMGDDAPSIVIDHSLRYDVKHQPSISSIDQSQ